MVSYLLYSANNNRLPRTHITRSITAFTTKFLGACLLTVSLLNSAHANDSDCPVIPDVGNYQHLTQWKQLLDDWLPQQNNCLRSSQYFSLIGAAQLNLGQYGDAQLALERALLIDADNGSAVLDYSQVLFNKGQLFAAIDLNQQLQQRADLPDHLPALLKARALKWESLTRRHTTQLSISSGYNSNLNSAPDLETLAVTLGSESGRLALSDRSREISGHQANMVLAQGYEWLSAERQQQLLLTLDGRYSQDTESDQQRITGQYISRTQQAYGDVEWDTRINYVNFGSKALYSDTEIGGRFEWKKLTNQHCSPLIKGRITHRHFYQDDNNDGILLALGTGLNCYFEGGILSANIEQVENIALKQRAGDNRHTTRFDLQWQQPLLQGLFSSYLQFDYSRDSAGYSPLLNNNEKRYILFTRLQLHYRQPIRKDLAWTLAANITEQRSNQKLFEQRSQRLDFGLEWRF